MLIENTMDRMMDEFIEEYEGEKNIAGIFDWLWNMSPLPFSDEQRLIVSEKSEAEAEILRSKGNYFYKLKNFEKALELFNLSIMAAPHPVLYDDIFILEDSPNKESRYSFPRIDPSKYGGTPGGKSKSLAKGFANRAAVMFELRLYRRCLQDIDLALEYGYPKELLHKLEGRQQRSHILQQATEKAIQPAEPEECLSLRYRLTRKSKKLPKLLQPNPDIPALSNAVQISYTPLKGRGIVASRDIHPGEVLGAERAFTVGIEEKKLSIYCSTCLCPCLTPLPCPGCAEVIFCSKICRTRGLSEDHWLECKILPSVILMKMGGDMELYKLLKTFSWPQLRGILSELQKDNPEFPAQLGFSDKGIYSSASYQSVYHLSQDHGGLPYGLLIDKCVASFCIAKVLELSGRYFVDYLGEPVKPSKNDFLKTCEVLVTNYLKEHINTFSCNHEENCWGLFPTFSLLNHSCYPSATILGDFSREAVIVALAPIAAGEEVSIAYQGNCTQRKEERMEGLKKYDFVCTCVVCEDNWPIIDDFPLLNFKCLYCITPLQERSFVCPICILLEKEGKTSENITWRNFQENIINEALDAAEQILQKRKQKRLISREEFQILCDAVEVIHKHSIMPYALLTSMRKVIIYYFDDCFQEMK